MTERIIVAISVIGVIWLFATAGSWGPVVDGECSAPKVKREVRL